MPRIVKKDKLVMCISICLMTELPFTRIPAISVQIPE